MASISELNDAYQAAKTPTTQGNGDLGKDEFLRLLTTQLKYQDPMEPMDNSEFVAQLSQFSSLEQLFNINETMGMGNDLSLAMNNTMMTSLIGKDIHFASDTLYQGDTGVSADIGFYLSNSGVVQVNILDENNQVVRSMNEGMLLGGEQQVSWDGKDDAGNVMAKGPYRVQVTYQSENGQESALTPYMVGHVSGLQVADGQPVLYVGDQAVSPSLIVAIFERNNT